MLSSRHRTGRPPLRLAGLLCLCLLLAVAPPALAAESALAERIEQIISQDGLSRAQVGVHVTAQGTDRVIYARSATRRFIAASNEKLVTAAAALDALGEDYEFETAVYADGDMDGGMLRGDLILRGGGDPTIGGRYDEEDALETFRRWARVLKAKGLRHVTGRVQADDGFFDRTRRHPHWSNYPAWKWYYTTSSALSINDNCVTVTVKPGAAPGSPALVSVVPASAPVQLLNLCKTASKTHAIWFDRAAGSDAIKVGGYVRQGTAGYSHPVAVPNPPLYAAAALKEALEAEGIHVDGAARVVDVRRLGPRSPAGPLVARRTAILPVLRMMVKRSHNHYAEQVIKTVGAETSGVGSWEAGLSHAAGMLRGMGFRGGDFNLDDGSGLSRRNELTPAILTRLLSRMQRSEHGAAFVSLLAVAGEDGTLKNRLTEQPYRGNVRAKTGYLNGVGALSGYATARSGIRIAFSILINDAHNPAGTYSMRDAVDNICRAIVDHAE
ncbi:MAG: D-alanyl-D-alanine carboxypeptidase/D-alanyl-D-alanine-endopeptidase [Candidatus Brocadiae bacterium]|nr:D-alanyl-D-alanine carboxypeptidase/D-alanyl-D-alanine-endopeptidase [Candidatus Brocadiia bacterium]